MASAKPKMKTQEGNVQVMVRVRPFSSREKAYSESRGQTLRPVVVAEGERITVLDPEADYEAKEAFAYDQVFWSTVGHDSANPIAKQADVYEKTGKVLLKSALEGYNCCVFAYGQTGAGKTYTMLGAPTSRGVSYLLIDDLFAHIKKQKEEDPGTIFTVEVSFMEIYNEQVRDLFNKKAKAGEYSPVKIRQDPVKGIIVQGLTQVKVSSAEQCAAEMERGVSERALAETKMNATSSRSHAICQISIVQANAANGLRRTSLVNLVDLAGSERLKMSGVEGTAAKEAKNINLSLSTLRRVFDTLIANSKRRDHPKHHDVPPYRESMLTWVLKESLGGNSKTMMVAAISPHEENLEDTYSTLRYALKAKAIVCKVICNEQPSAKMVASLREELEAMKAKLADGGGEGLSTEERAEIEAQHAEDLAMKEQALEEAQKMEEQMEEVRKMLQAQVEQLEEERADMRLRVSNEKRIKFARAFRAAFAIKKEKVELETVAADLCAALAKNKDLAARNTELEDSLRALRADMQQERRAMQRDNTVLTRQVQSYRSKAAHVDAGMLDLELRKTELETEGRAVKAKLLSAEYTAVQLQQALNDKRERAEEMEVGLQYVPDLRRRVRELEAENGELREKKEAYKRKTAALMLQREADERVIAQLRKEQNAQQREFVQHVLEGHAAASVSPHAHRGAAVSVSPSPPQHWGYPRSLSPSPRASAAPADADRLIKRVSASLEGLRQVVATPLPVPGEASPPPTHTARAAGSPVRGVHLAYNY